MELTLWAVLAATGALWIRVGFAVHAAGMARSKNSAGAVMRHLTDAAVALLAFWAVGFAVYASGNRVFGVQWRALFGVGVDYSYGSPLAAAMVLIATGIVPGVLAERARFWPALAASALLAAVIIPTTMLWSTGGWLSHLGYRDPGGAGWLHLAGATCAAIGARVVGARGGKFNRDGSSTAIPGHSVPLAGIGTAILFVGFFTFLTPVSLNQQVAQTSTGVLAAAAAMNVLLAAAAGAMAAVCLSNFRYYKPDIHLTYAGLVGGLVAISAAGPAVGSLCAVIIGAVAGVIVPLALLHIDLILRLDDPSGNVAIHGVGAIWGLLATPLFAQGLTVGERAKQFGVHALAIVSIAALSAILSLALWLALKRFTKLRASEAEEFDGLDLAEHDIGAYPDFQQTMIKSYHLREV